MVYKYSVHSEEKPSPSFDGNWVLFFEVTGVLDIDLGSGSMLSLGQRK